MNEGMKEGRLLIIMEREIIKDHFWLAGWRNKRGDEV